jgi:hypothetical protein
MRASKADKLCKLLGNRPDNVCHVVGQQVFLMCRKDEEFDPLDPARKCDKDYHDIMDLCQETGDKLRTEKRCFDLAFTMYDIICNYKEVKGSSARDNETG